MKSEFLSMATLENFHEIGIPTTDILESVEFYRRLGFTEIEVGAIRTGLYAVMTDGRIALGFYVDRLEEAALSFVQPQIADCADKFEKLGLSISFRNFGLEQFHELGGYGPDGHLITIVEAKTFSESPHAEMPEPVLGRSAEITLKAPDISRSVAFWTGCGFSLDADEDDNELQSYVRVIAPGITLGLRASVSWPAPMLRFETDDIDAVMQEVARLDIAAQPAAENSYVIVAPEGTRLIVAPREMIPAI
jgi:catechol 2,3-dioxygenase-like lactoylglutathione lyase family enzyme